MDIAEIRLKTHMLWDLYHFYVDILDFSLIDEQDDNITVDAGATRIIFEEDDDDEHLYHIAFNIPNNQLVDAKAWLAQRTELMTIGEDDDEIEWTDWNAKAVYFQDPAGNILEFIARFDIDNDSNLPFSGQSVLRVSEVGLAAKKPHDMVKQIRAAFPIDVFDAGSEDFVALGTNTGLFIVVKEGRAWFPTKKSLAVRSPLEITLRGDRDVSVKLSQSDYVIKMIDTSSE